MKQRGGAKVPESCYEVPKGVTRFPITSRGSRGSLSVERNALSTGASDVIPTSAKTVIPTSVSEEKSRSLSRNFLASQNFSLQKISRFARKHRRIHLAATRTPLNDDGRTRCQGGPGPSRPTYWDRVMGMGLRLLALPSKARLPLRPPEGCPGRRRPSTRYRKRCRGPRSCERWEDRR